MAIAYDTLFTDLGHLGSCHLSVIGELSGTAPASATTWGSSGPKIKALNTCITDIFSDFSSSHSDLVANLYSQRDSFRASASSFLDYIRSVAENTIIQLVNDDSKLPSLDIQTALKELIRQMTADSKSVLAATVTATVAALGTPTGNPTVIASVIRPDGKTCEYAFQELIHVIVTADSQAAGNATAGQEPLSITGQAAASGKYSTDWPLGSAASSSITMVDPTQNAAGGNLLYNSSFDAFTVANTPDYWGSPLVGVYGTDIFSEATTVYRAGGKSLKFTGTGGSPLSSIAQKFNVSSPATGTSGTTSVLKPKTIYAVSCQARKSASAAAGVINLRLLDQAGTPAVVNDDASTANSATIAVGSLSSSAWTNFTAFFRTPSVLPSTGLQLGIRVSTAITSGESIYVDDLAMYEVGGDGQIYNGGPSIVAFRGSTDVVTGDTWTVTVANSAKAPTVPAKRTFQFLFDTWWDMRGMGLQIPSAGSPSHADATYLV